jgi:hypothetical protein
MPPALSRHTGPASRSSRRVSGSAASGLERASQKLRRAQSGRAGKRRRRLAAHPQKSSAATLRVAKPRHALPSCETHGSGACRGHARSG